MAAFVESLGLDALFGFAEMPFSPPEDQQRNIHELLQGVGVELLGVEEVERDGDVDESNGKTPGMAANGEPDTDNAGCKTCQLEGIHGGKLTVSQRKSRFSVGR